MLLFGGLGVFVVYTGQLVAQRVVVLDEAFEETAVQTTVVDAAAHLILAMHASRLALHEMVLEEPNAEAAFAESIVAFDEQMETLVAAVRLIDPALVDDLDAIEEQHARFHEDAERILMLITTDALEEAEAFVEKDLDAELRAIESELELFEEQVESRMFTSQQAFDAELHQVEVEIGQLRGITAVLLLLGLLLAGGLSLWLGRLIREPVDRLVETAVSIEQGSFKLEPLSGLNQRQDEFGLLARVFQGMAIQVEARETDLKQQVRKLQITIDRTQQKQQVAEITETDFFQNLETRAAALRKRRQHI